jgi:hypothetical protein
MEFYITLFECIGSFIDSIAALLDILSAYIVYAIAVLLLVCAIVISPMARTVQRLFKTHKVLCSFLFLPSCRHIIRAAKKVVKPQ